MPSLFSSSNPLLGGATPLRLAQSPSVTALTPAEASGGEPSLSLALSSLASDEVAEYRAWDAVAKKFFLMGYQWLAVASAKNLERMDGSSFTGFFQEGLKKAADLLDAATPYAGSFDADASDALSSAIAVEREAATKTLPKISEVVGKYRLLRDRVAWELASSGESVEYEVVGNDPQNPGYIFKRHVGPDSAPDVSAVFSGLSPKQAYEDGADLEDAFEGLGVAFKRMDLSGVNLSAASAMPILAVVITLVIGVLAFYYLFNRSAENGNLNKAVLDAIAADATLSTEQKTALIEKVKASESFFSSIFGSSFSWTTVIIGATVTGLAFFVVPQFLAKGGGH